MFQLNDLILIVLLRVLRLCHSSLEVPVSLKQLLILLDRPLVLLIYLLEPLLEQLQFLSMLHIQLIILKLQPSDSLFIRSVQLLGELADALVLGLELEQQLLLVPLTLLLVLDHALHVRDLLDDQPLSLLGLCGIMVQGVHLSPQITQLLVRGVQLEL